jgi:hypothetical protein
VDVQITVVHPDNPDGNYVAVCSALEAPYREPWAAAALNDAGFVDAGYDTNDVTVSITPLPR